MVEIGQSRVSILLGLRGQRLKEAQRVESFFILMTREKIDSSLPP
jgi:hypothetical protein